MPDTSALNLATAFLDAFTAGDFDTASQSLAPDFTFDGPIAHYRSAAEFLASSRRFVETIQPGWNKIAAFGNDSEALLLYDVALRSGALQRIADYYTVKNGKIQTEVIVFDTGALRPM